MSTPPPKARLPRIGISGSYGGLNLGDEAILEGILTRLRATVDAEITVFSRNAADTRARVDVEHVIPVGPDGFSIRHWTSDVERWTFAAVIPHDKLFTPGPVEVSEKTLAALSLPDDWTSRRRF